MVKRFFWTAILVLAALLVWYLADLPDTSKLRKINPKTSAIRVYREENLRKAGKKPHSVMIWRGLDQISPNLVHAVILSEDDTFYQHHGFDFAQMKRAMEVNWERKRFSFGGSTLTQQLARTLYLSSRKNLLRKAKEALITRRLEATLSKKRIIELYLNVVEWGPQIYGAEAASRHFFNKPAIDLSAEEAISLALILPSPRHWNPLSESRFMARRRTVLYGRMVRAHHIVPEAPLFEDIVSSTGEAGSPPEAPADEDNDQGE